MNPNDQAPSGSDVSSQETAKVAPETTESGPSYLTVTKTFASWALTLDHKRIGLMYLVGVLGMFFLGGVFALLVRTEASILVGAIPVNSAILTVALL